MKATSVISKGKSQLEAAVAQRSALAPGQSRAVKSIRAFSGDVFSVIGLSEGGCLFGGAYSSVFGTCWEGFEGMLPPLDNY